MLAELRSYLQTHGRAPLGDIALHLQMEPSAVRPLLQKWQRKGKVVKLEAEQGCSSGCNKCDPDSLELYAWQEEQTVRFHPATKS
ncbi:MAG TPA: sugar metabolism transcriptional regulator [Gammaproteobacteria bacterium]|nr:sugar metabolism transcriptional regulator [Gammaproteobacteria bacterium]